MFGLFLMVCSTLSCQFEPYGYIYPDEQNGLIDREAFSIQGKILECNPIDAVIRADY